MEGKNTRNHPVTPMKAILRESSMQQQTTLATFAATYPPDSMNRITITGLSRHSSKGGKIEFWECEGGTSALINVFFQIPKGALRIQGGKCPPPPFLNETLTMLLTELMARDLYPIFTFKMKDFQ